MNNEELWKEFLSRIQLITQPFTYNTWFKTTKLLRIDNCTCVIKVDTDFQKDFLALLDFLSPCAGTDIHESTVKKIKTSASLRKAFNRLHQKGLVIF